MKKMFSFIVFVFLFSFVLSAETLHSTYLDRSEFISDINSALTSESAEALVQAAAIYLTKMHEANIPDCFACSLYLIKITENADPKMQLTAADLAVKFSNDLPEVHHQYFSRLIRFTPLQADKILMQFFAAVKTSLHFIFKDSTNFLVLKSLSKICFILSAQSANLPSPCDNSSTFAASESS